MEHTSSIICFNCERSLPIRAKFCGSCRTQIKCIECGTELEKGDIACMECGKEIKELGSSTQTNFNSIDIHETPTERNISARFSDAVGKDLTGILRDAMNNRTDSNKLISSVANDEIQDTEYQEVPISPANEEKPKPVVQFQSTTDSRLPLMTVAMRALPASEVEWVLIYAYYASNFGKNLFKRQDIISKYEETKRWSNDKSKNLSGNIRVNVRGAKFNVFEDNYSILEKGIELAEDILKRTKSTVLTSNSAKKNKDNEKDVANEKTVKKQSNGSSKTKRLNDIDFYPAGKEDIETFYNKFNAKNDYEKILIFVHYMSEILEIKNISYDHIYTCFDTLGLKIPLNVPQVARNSASDKGWIDAKANQITVTTNGRNKMRKWN